MGWIDGSTLLPYTSEQMVRLEGLERSAFRGWLDIEKRKASAEKEAAEAAAKRLAAERDTATRKADAAEQRIRELDLALRVLDTKGG